MRLPTPIAMCKYLAFKGAPTATVMCKYYAFEKCKGLLNRTSELKEEDAASSTQVVNSSYVCLVHKQMCHTQKLENEVDKYMF